MAATDLPVAVERPIASPAARAAAGLAAAVRRPRPGERLTGAARRAVWILAIAVAAGAGPLFSWTLGRARQAPPAQAALPRADVRLLNENDRLARRISHDEKVMQALAGQLTQIGAQGTGGPVSVVATGLPAVRTAPAPRTHAVTGAS